MNGKSAEKVCLFSGDISRGGGTERVGVFLANSLSKEMENPVSVVSITEAATEPRFRIDPKVRRFQLSSQWIQPGPGYVILMYRLYRLIRREGFTVVIDIDGVLDVLTIPCRLFTGIKVISWVHFCYGETLGTKYRALIRRFTCRFSDHIVVLTQRDADAYLRQEHAQCPVSVIPNALDIQKSPASSVIPKCKKVAAVGALDDIKGFDLLIGAAALVIPRFPDWHFYVYGEGKKRGELEELVRRHHLENHVFFPGFCSDLDQIYGDASVFAMTSRSEGLPMALLEAKYFRLPSVSFDIASGPAEIILDGVNGFLVPPFEVRAMADRLSELMENSELRKNFSEHAWDNIGEFEKTAIIEKWIELIENIRV